VSDLTPAAQDAAKVLLDGAGTWQAAVLGRDGARADVVRRLRKHRGDLTDVATAAVELVEHLAETLAVATGEDREVVLYRARQHVEGSVPASG
jgi:hypothetical protein